jgi:hypothetical protein
MELNVDKRLKIDKPLGTIYLSHKPRPIKVTNIALSETTKANEIASKTAKTRKVTAVVVVMSIFSRKRCKLQSANLGNERPSRQKAERANFPEENTRGSRSPSQKSRKGQIPKKLASKSKNLDLNHTNLMLNSKKTQLWKKIELQRMKKMLLKKLNNIINNLNVMSNVLSEKHFKNHINIRDLDEFDSIPCSDCAKKPDPSISSGLHAKNKTIRVLLDSGSSGDLLFIKKSPVNAFPL